MNDMSFKVQRYETQLDELKAIIIALSERPSLRPGDSVTLVASHSGGHSDGIKQIMPNY